jgi:hypothetical protein
MNFLKQYLHHDNRRKVLNYLRPWAYYSHPVLKVNHIPKQRWRMLMTMRDLRQWIHENAPFSSRAIKYEREIYYLNKEINYLQMKAMIMPVVLIGFACVYFLFWGPQHWQGSPGIQGRPM